MALTIFTEGEWDTPFISEIIKRNFGINKLKEIRIIDTNGYNGIDVNLPYFQETSDLGDINLVIFDADGEHNGGGFQKRYDELVAKKHELGVEFHLFLFPDNKSDGMFENLLQSVVCANHVDVLACFDGYLACIEANGLAKGINYSLPALKSKIFAYAEAVLTPKELKKAIKNKTWAYENDDIWDFNSQSLNPLKEFLTTHLT